MGGRGCVCYEEKQWKIISSDFLTCFIMENCLCEKNDRVVTNFWFRKRCFTEFPHLETPVNNNSTNSNNNSNLEQFLHDNHNTYGNRKHLV